ncbi:hypothetical protein THASP1DRAFT_26655, partial [Thamnocephalis sphaerospora]
MSLALLRHGYSELERDREQAGSQCGKSYATTAMVETIPAEVLLSFGMWAALQATPTPGRPDMPGDLQASLINVNVSPTACHRSRVQHLGWQRVKHICTCDRRPLHVANDDTDLRGWTTKTHCETKSGSTAARARAQASEIQGDAAARQPHPSVTGKQDGYAAVGTRNESSSWSMWRGATPKHNHK